MIPKIDMSAKLIISNTAYDNTNKYLYTNNTQLFFMVEEISFAVDSNFISNGELQMSVNGSPITSQAGVSTGITPQNTFSIRAGEKSFWILEAGESFETKFKMSSGSGVVQVILTGSLLNKSEYEALLRNKGLI